ncbi:hypothetical protein F2Q69_00025077 [Brassica cretica]|uniref:Uncharacterized protein n=1 Tax=Brassica cretica TaxID=69181 RepID=A0A8S9Q9Q2_BRACR|nr:hypothetical protein F2Q69_00025077 [Brassica cretica]
MISLLLDQESNDLIPSNVQTEATMGASDRPLAFADYSVSPKWVFLYLGLLGLFLIGLLICFCWKRRETSAAVTPVGDLEMANAAP